MREVSSRPSSSWIAARHLLSSSGESWIPIQPDIPYLATRSAERFASLRPLKYRGGCGFLDWLCAETAGLEIGELAVVLENVVGPDALHDLDGFPGTWACRRLNRCVALAAANSSGIHPDPTATFNRTVGEVVDGGQLGSKDAGRTKRRVR